MSKLSGLRDRVERADGRLLMAAVLMVAIMATQFVSSMFFSLTLGLFTDTPTMPHVAALTAITSYAVVLSLVWRNLTAEEGVSITDIGVRAGRFSWPATLGIAILIYLTMSMIAGIYVQTTGYVNEQQITSWVSESLEGDPVVLGLLLVAVVVMGPVVEELVFRGYLQSALAEKMPPWVAVALSSLVFGAFHLELGAFPLLVLAGAGMGAVYQITGALWPAILMHMVSNGLSAFLIYRGNTEWF